MNEHNMSNLSRINTYTCPSNHVLVTRDIDSGVTPMFKKCPTCGADARSGFYNNELQRLTPTHEWYKPAYPERYAHPGLREHCMKGGLAFRAIGEPDETEAMKPLRADGHRVNTFSDSVMSRLTNRNRFQK
ncbi:hypothetical protein FAES_1808 [Fibrella aestuarina BUZ 2]|uniref:Uncharacterized protein n=1 Tax=Fibrella aestuarina BUZ 2 TaxID=1166018 RepID=I0K6R5_9BACT|nr:hypothetical protein [Fibrella aestuarina]CCG99818.1 hypothetical protein FAES_1808 [Fibrella aestuarina BUZ 2]